jgi:ATP-dependent Clp protease ATP-binding subunit ClpA
LWLGRSTEWVADDHGGARNVDNILTNTLLPEISKQILAGIAEGTRATSIRVGIGDNVRLSIRRPETIASCLLPRSIAHFG